MFAEWTHLSIPDRYYKIPASRKEGNRTSIKETSGLLYRDRSRPQGLSLWEHNDDDDDDDEVINTHSYPI
jgi:hypothetical protein